MVGKYGLRGCTNCGRTWPPKKVSPVSCPRCKQYDGTGNCKIVEITPKEEDSFKKRYTPRELDATKALA